MTHPSALEEIDRVVDRTILDKARAARLKEALHLHYDLTRPTEPGEPQEPSTSSDEHEAFWDNVPV